MTKLSDAELDTKISATELLLRAMKFERRARAAGVASGRARKHAVRDAEICRFYRETEGRYGALKETAGRFRLTPRQIQRIVQAELLAKAGRVFPSAPLITVAEEKPSAVAKRRAKPSSQPTDTETPKPAGPVTKPHVKQQPAPPDNQVAFDFLPPEATS